MRDVLSDFAGLRSYMKVKPAGLSFKEGLLGYYESLGLKYGFTVRRNAPVVKHGINLGRMDLVWIEPNTVFALEFGNFDELLKSLWKITEFKPELAILVLSSKSQCKPAYAAELIKKTPILADLKGKFLVLDVGEEKVAYP